MIKNLAFFCFVLFLKESIDNSRYQDNLAVTKTIFCINFDLGYMT